MFWFEICDRGKYHSWFPSMNLTEAQRVWLAMQEQFFAKYERFVREWPEWYSSGIWSAPYPGSRASGGMIAYSHLDLSADLVARFKEWQTEYNGHKPWAPKELDWHSHARTADGLAGDLKAALGPRIYVEHPELLEVMADGSTVSCRERLGLPEPE